MAKRIIATLNATLNDGAEVMQGEEVDLIEADEQRLDAERALVPHGFDSFDQFSAHKQDVYRAGRGDITAAQNLDVARSGGIPDIDAVPGAGADATSYAEWMRAEKPSVGEVVDAAGDDPAKAAALLEAENLVTSGEPRKGVESKLSAIIDNKD